MIKIKRLLPDHYVVSAFDLNFLDLKDRGIMLILFDIDNTLIAHGGRVLGKFASDVFLKAEAAGLECMLFSNAGKRRLQEIAGRSGIDYVRKPMKPFGQGIQRLIRSRQGLSADNIAVVGDQLFTDILAGNNAGTLTILVDPISVSEPFQIRLKRMIEKLFKKRIAID